MTLEQLINEVALEDSAETAEPQQTVATRVEPLQPQPQRKPAPENSNQPTEAFVPLRSKLQLPRSSLGYQAPSNREPKRLFNSSLNFKGTIGASKPVDQITNIEPATVPSSEPIQQQPIEEAAEIALNPQELLESMLESPHEDNVFENLKRFLSEFAHRPLIESESGVVAFVAREETDRHIRVFVGSMQDFCLMSGDGDSIEGQLTIDEVFEYDEEENQPLMIIRKTSQQLAPSIAGRKTFLVLEFKGFENGPGAATHTVKKEWH
ncbi:MAG: hypothetical protein K2W95_25290 [Candidatus Obscuribacterales bacterium]|nr:hypothetical protein [Candidatus Obscuribacterales bacterium]